MQMHKKQHLTANTLQTRKLVRAAIQRSIANFDSDVQVLSTYTAKAASNSNVRYVTFMLRAATVAQLHDVHDFASMLFADAMQANRITLTGVSVNANMFSAYLHVVTYL